MNVGSASTTLSPQKNYIMAGTVGPKINIGVSEHADCLNIIITLVIAVATLSVLICSP